MMSLTGFSLGDELGFPESLGNLEGSRRRALNQNTGANSVVRQSPSVSSQKLAKFATI